MGKDKEFDMLYEFGTDDVAEIEHDSIQAAAEKGVKWLFFQLPEEPMKINGRHQPMTFE